LMDEMMLKDEGKKELALIKKEEDFTT